MTFVVAGRRVVVTGLGAVTPLGADVPTYWRRLVAGDSGVGPITLFDASQITSRVAGEVLDFDPSGVLDRKEVRRNDRVTQMALVATREAFDDAGLPERLEGEMAEQTGILMGSGLGGTNTLIDQIATCRIDGPNRVSPFFIPMAIANMPAGVAGIRFGALGPNYSTTSACASSGHAIGEAYEIIKRGDADIMVGGGCEAPVADATVAGFARMKALSTRNDDPKASSRPFDADRDGFVVAEGAGALVLEELEHAQRRGARIYAEVCGYGATADGHHITTPSPGGAGAVRAARRALDKAGLEASDIDFVSAHATSTGEGDPTELMGINTLVGENAPNVSVTATKSSIGHTLGAAGAIAAVA
ncbi:MAG: beta-ketoacyl-ACP synthase II, partial [Chloroflexota bacterium]|nr:beta-ketoacyl-ACP synthase II [Chloroflexota bacterium]